MRDIALAEQHRTLPISDQALVRAIISPMNLAIIGEYNPAFAPHRHTDEAIAHSAAALNLTVEFQWVSTVDEKISDVGQFDGLWFAPGSPYRDLQRTLDAVEFGRKNNIPCLGTCGGFQHMVIEYARNAANISQADHEEYDPYASELIISKMECSLVGRELAITLLPESKTARAYGQLEVVERYYCDFGVNPDFIERLANAGLHFVGRDSLDECRVLEIFDHPFFVGTLFVPQARSTPSAPHPLINAFLKECQRAAKV